ncbi:MAG: HAMP domain-containing histidine kinase [Lachnospiraceae bacterium]|nr:HAMP domain-containing histidine kinase [Lachnospiraceae bacterium]
MNTQKKYKIFNPGSRIVVRLWSIMMVLVFFGIGFMWVAQILLFEHSYTEMALEETEKRLQPIMKNLTTQDLAEDERMLSGLSRMAGGELILMNHQGKLLEMYSAGHKVDIKNQREEEMIWNGIKRRPEFLELLQGHPYRVVDKHRDKIFGFELGIPVTYEEEPCFVILHNILLLKTTLDFNRRQLILLTVLLTVIASVLAFLLSRQFTRPIFQIKEAVDRLTRNDFCARPGLNRKDELGQLSDSVEQLGQSLQQVDVLRKEVIANVSHELRSPLSVIGGYAEMLRDITWKDDVQREEGLNLIISEARRMGEMVSDILDYSQLQAGYTQLKKDWYNLYEILESEVILCRHSASPYQISLELICPDKELMLYLDALKISQVIRNLLYNAINHTKDKESITILAKTDKNQVCVSVINPGTPIPEAEHQLIWERYHRSQHQSGRRLGTGIGLSIVKTILDAHEMDYGVNCQKGKINFWFSCPFCPPPAH